MTAAAQDFKKERSPLVAGFNEFGMDLFKSLCRENAGNVVLSPLGVSRALTVASLGARNETAAEMRRVLRLSGDAEHVVSHLSDLTKTLGGAHGKSHYSLSSSFWTQKGWSIRPQFLGLLSKSEGLEMREVDFTLPGAASDEINAWVKKETRGGIDRILTSDSLNKEARFVVVSAECFFSHWLHAFSPKGTKDTEFSVSADSKKTVQTMRHYLRLKYYATPDVQVVELPYSDKRRSMVIILPKTFEQFHHLQKTIGPVWLERQVADLRDHMVDLSIPKFRLDYNAKLGKHLELLGIKAAFSLRADFSHVSKEELRLGEAYHRTTFQVDEDGTTYASATAVAGIPIPVSAPLPNVRFYADRPFIFVIQDQATGAFLSVGKVVNP